MATVTPKALVEGILLTGTAATLYTTPTVDTTPPTVTILAPADGSRVKRRSTVRIRVACTPAGGLASIAYTANGSPLPGGDFLSCPWAVPGKPNAAYTIQVTVRDAAGQAAAASVRVRAV